MTDQANQPPEDAFDAPRGLTKDLFSLYHRPVHIPAAIDQAIRARATQHAARLRRMRILLRWGGGAAAAAAILLIALRLMPSHQPTFNPAARVTILDAFSLARQLQSGQKPDKSWDVNHDGVIDQKDIDALAAQAVQLPQGGVQ